MRNSFFTLFFTFVCACSSSPESRVEQLPYFNSPDFTPRWLKPSSLPADFHRVPEFSLKSHQKKEITESELNGKITVVDFFFSSCPGICPKLLKHMALLESELSDFPDLLLLSHSVTPEKDSVSVLRRYAQKNKIESSRWHFLTGERSVIYRLARKAYFAEEDLGLEKGDDDFLHTENFVLIDRKRHIRGVYNGINRTSVQQLITDIRTLAVE